MNSKTPGSRVPCTIPGCALDSIVVAGRGRPSERCLKHASSSSRYARLDTIMKCFGPIVAAQEAEKAGVSCPARIQDLAALAVGDTSRASGGGAASAGPDAERLAIGMSVSPNLREAAKLVDLDNLSDDELEALAVEAREKHEGLIAGTAGSLAQVGRSFIGIAMLRLRATVNSLKPRELGQVIKHVSDACDKLSGGIALPTYQDVTLEIHEAEDPSKVVHVAKPAQRLIVWDKKTG